MVTSSFVSCFPHKLNDFGSDLRNFTNELKKRFRTIGADETIQADKQEKRMREKERYLPRQLLLSKNDEVSEIGVPEISTASTLELDESITSQQTSSSCGSQIDLSFLKSEDSCQGKSSLDWIKINDDKYLIIKIKDDDKYDSVHACANDDKYIDGNKPINDYVRKVNELETKFLRCKNRNFSSDPLVHKYTLDSRNYDVLKDNRKFQQYRGCIYQQEAKQNQNLFSDIPTNQSIVTNSMIAALRNRDQQQNSLRKGSNPIKILAPCDLFPGSVVRANVHGIDVRASVPIQGIKKGEEFYISNNYIQPGKQSQFQSHNLISKARNQNISATVSSVKISAPLDLQPGSTIRARVHGKEIVAIVPSTGIRKGCTFQLQENNKSRC